MSDWNTKIIEEFRANGGKVGGTYENRPLLLLTTTGAKSKQQHTTPLAFMKDGDRLIIVASMLGAPKNPAWYHNIVAHPEVTIELGSETFPATATVIEGEQRTQLWARTTEEFPILADHQAKTTRQIPLIAITRH
ncbi:nitroreductase family deazaflavin-dependent oxidoreductase [Dictyobacter arantiisoli]|uniref:Nitroreductase n=1 Tax=Dictyobacter arantiisoli TaxID=2014874 RepID=A0A5A5T7T7_9CHLR|nr:nitroreductase family deazaflavin-dependent oxidoreductase [Dictyobacter arantiisoli]GCF07019.1 hypothetical protein KDI_05830 [Dictyobacter arantiisoli]